MTNIVKLENIEEFRSALEGYQISDHAKKILSKMPLVILLGLFGGGRNSIIKVLIDSDKYKFIVSDTTRPPKVRDGALEMHGVQYYFRNESDMLRDIQNGEFLEAELIHNQQVSGISIRELEVAHESGKIPIGEVDLLGTVNILKAKPDAIMIFIVPPSYEEWLRRIRQRETMSSEEFGNRMTTAERILRTVIDSDSFKFVINDTLEHAAQRIEEIVHHGRHSEEHQLEARAVARQLLAQLSRLNASTLD